MTLQPTYRISQSSGVTYVRERILGEVVGRLVSQYSIYVDASAAAIVAECQPYFEGTVESFEHDGDTIIVRCVPPMNAHDSSS